MNPALIDPSIGRLPERGEADATGLARRALSGRSSDGDLCPRALPHALGGAAAARADRRPAATHERADDEPRAGPRQRRLCGGDGLGGAVRPASAATTDDGALRGAARDRVGPRSGGARSRDVHRRARAAGPLHEPPVDRSRAAVGARLRLGEVPLDGDDHERLHLRGSRAWTRDRRDPGKCRRVASAVLDRRRDRAPRRSFCRC